MEFLIKKPIYLVIAVAVGFALWKLPEALNRSETYNESRPVKELDQYLADKGKPLSGTDSLEMRSFYDLLGKLAPQMEAAKQGGCKLKEKTQGVAPRIMAVSLLDYVQDSIANKEIYYFDEVSTLNSKKPFNRLNMTLGDGFTGDLAHENWHQGFMGYVRNLQKDGLLFIAKVENVIPPRMIARRNFYAGTATVGIWACDLKEGKVLCKQSIDVKSDNSSGLPMKGSAMNKKIRLELLEKAAIETELWCKQWMAQ